MMAYFFWQDEDPILDKMAHTTAVCEPFDPAVTAASAARHSISGAGHVSAGAGGGSASTVVQQLTSTPLLPHPQPPPAAEHHTRSPPSPPGPDHTRCTPAASLLDRKRLYLAASRALMRHRGTVRAMHDARDIAKAICLSEPPISCKKTCCASPLPLLLRVSAPFTLFIPQPPPLSLSLLYLRRTFHIAASTFVCVPL